MIHRTFTFCLVVFALTGSAFGQQTASVKSGDLSVFKTAGTLNGRFWKSCSETEKDIFLFGYSDGLDVVAIATSSDFPNYKIVRKKFWADSLTADEVRVALDRFYEIPENGPIGIPNAIVVIARRSEGLDEESVQKMIYGLRAIASKNQEAK